MTNTLFAEGTTVIDHYSGTEAKVTDGKVTLSTDENIVLLAQKK